jgi:hypothetical protein
MDVHDLIAPPPAADFRERLWERAEEWQRRRARRWRVAALAATAVAVASISAAGVFALDKGVARTAGPPTFDQSISCQVVVRGGIPVIDLTTEPTGWYSVNGVRKPSVATMLLSTSSFGGGQSANYLSFQSGPHVYGPLEDAPCTKAPPIPLARAGLPLAQTLEAPSPTDAAGATLSCFTGATIAIRQHLKLVKGTPVAGQVAVRTGKKLRPLLYVDWTPKKITVYASGDCHE